VVVLETWVVVETVVTELLGVVLLPADEVTEPVPTEPVELPVVTPVETMTTVLVPDGVLGVTTLLNPGTETVPDPPIGTLTDEPGTTPVGTEAVTEAGLVPGTEITTEVVPTAVVGVKVEMTEPGTPGTEAVMHSAGVTVTVTVAVSRPNSPNADAMLAEPMRRATEAYMLLFEEF